MHCNLCLNLLCSSYDVLFLNGSEEILASFQEANASILFAAENSCWPVQELAVRMFLVLWPLYKYSTYKYPPTIYLQLHNSACE